MYGTGINAYHETNIMTGDPMRLVILCYEGAIDSLKLAKERFIAKDFESKAKAITKANDIINELMQALDFERGGEVAKSLDAVYNYTLRRILEGDLKKDLSVLDEAIRILEELKSAWEQIFCRHTKVEPPLVAANEVRRS
jgi:flagellar protein FliS